MRKTNYVDFYIKATAEAFMSQLTKSGAIKAYLQTMSGSRYQVRYW